MTECADALRVDLAEVVKRVYETMLGADALADAKNEMCFETPLTAAVHYAGGWKGALVLECSSAQAEQWTARLMPFPTPISYEDACDGLGELTNMIAGNLKPLLPPGVTLSMPSVIAGVDHRLHLPDMDFREVMSFADESGPFRISLVRFLEKPARRPNSGAAR